LNGTPLKEDRKLFFDTERLEKLRQRDSVSLSGFSDRLTAGYGAPDTAHTELKKGFGCFGLGLEEIIDGTVSGYFGHSILRLTPREINLTIAAKKINPTLSLRMLTLYSPYKTALVNGDV
jgi:hypothetical protein